MITQEKTPCLFIKFSQTFLKEMRGYQFGEFVCGYWDLQGKQKLCNLSYNFAAKRVK